MTGTFGRFQAQRFGGLTLAVTILTTTPYGSISGFGVNDGSLYLTGTWSGTLVGGGTPRTASSLRDGYVMR